MRRSAVLFALALAACAPSSSNPTPQSVAPTGTRVRTYGTDESAADVDLPAEALATTVALPATPDQVWQRLPAAYASVGIDVKMSDPTKLTLGNVDYHPHTTRDRRLSDWFNCGTTSLGTVIADRYAMTVSVQSQVLPAASGSTLTTTVSAFARDMSGTSSAAVRCSTRGGLEHAIHAAVAASLMNRP
jgi:hypothetical protein